MRRTPLKRSRKPLKRSRLSPVSPKRKELLRDYTEARRAYLAEHPICEVCKKEPATEIHHTGLHGGLVKRGSNVANSAGFLAVCRPCHLKIHANPAWARDHQFLK